MRSAVFSLSLFIAASICLIVSTVWPAAAQEDQRGRLPDGRAYRTDAQGLELVDYIAELELNVAELKRKVTGLEGELQQKNQALSRAARTGTLDGGVVEVDLLKGRTDSVQEPQPVQKIVEPPPCVEPPRPEIRPVDLSVACEPRVQALQSQIEQTKLLAVQQQESQKAQLNSWAVQRLNYEEQNRSCEERLRLIQGEKQNDLGVAGELRLKLAESESRAQQTLSKLAESEGRFQQVVQQLEEARAQLAQTRIELAEVSALQTRTASKAVVPAVIPPAAGTPVPHIFPVTTAAEPPVIISSRASLSPERLLEVNRLRSRLRSELNALRDDLSKRDARYKAYQSTGGQVSFRLSAPVSPRNRGIEQIGREIALAQNMSELTALQSDIRDIRSKIADDLALLKRMAK